MPLLNQVATSFAAVGLLSAAGLTYVSVSTYQALFEQKAAIKIGTDLKVLNSNYSLDQQIIGADNPSPQIIPIKIRLGARTAIAMRDQQFVITMPEDELLSAIEKAQQTPERVVRNILAQRLIEMTDQTLIAGDSTLDVPIVEEVAAAELHPGISVALEETMAEPAHDQRALKEVLSSRPKKKFAKKILDTQPKAVSTQAEEMKPFQTFVAWNEIQGAGRLTYSDVVDAFLGKSAQKDLQAEQKQSEQKQSEQVPAVSHEELSVTTSSAAIYDNEGPASLVIQPKVTSEPKIEVAAVEPAKDPVDVKAFMMDTQQGTVGPQPPMQGMVTQVIQVPPAKEVTETAAQTSTAPKTSLDIQPKEIPVTTQAAIASAPIRQYSGRLVEAFTSGAKPVVQATVQILGTPWTAVSDAAGNFSFDQNMLVEGVLPVVITKDSFLKRRVDLVAGKPIEVELVSENSVNLSAVTAGQTAKLGAGFVFGQFTSAIGDSIASLRVDVVGPTPATVVYLDDNGIPSSKLQTTSSRGQFIVLNMVPGTYMVAVLDAMGVEKAAHIIHVGDNEGVVRKFNLGSLKYIRGHVYNASTANAPVEKATVQLLGNRQTAITGAKGQFVLGPVHVDCGDLNYLQVEKSGFYRNRIDYACTDDVIDHKIYTFTAAYTDSVSSEANVQLRPGTAVVLGHTNFTASVKMQLWGPEEVNPSESLRGRDFYFDTDGVLERSLNRTTKSGNFAILEAPEGLSYIQAFSSSNKTLSYWPIYLSPSTVNVYIQ